MRANEIKTDEAFAAWIDQEIRPNAFVTILMPSAAERDPMFYLSLVTRKAEAALWGQSALHVSNYDDRCLWMFVAETIRQSFQKSGNVKPTKLRHYHGLLRMPTRPMLIEQGNKMLTTSERCQRLQDALIEATTRTPKPFATGSSLDRLRGADILAEPYRSDVHSKYVFKQLRPRFREHWTERLDGPLLRDHGLLILPNLPKTKTTNPQEHRDEPEKTTSSR
jgi:hypothetical protein